jgi:serine/threonine protein kinase
MNVSSKCPSAADLRELLDGSLPESDQTAVVSHLDQCSPCQQSLEALANPDSSFTATLLEQASYKAPDAASAYWPALKNAQQALTVATPAPTARKSSPDISLAFLQPPEDGSHMGTLGGFNVVGVVGRGGMGIVLQAVDTCLQRDVALKILDPQFSQDELARTRFCREARAAASISHENVVAIHYVEEDEEKGIPFLVMELITGESLEQKLLREGALPLREIVRIGMQTAAGLAAAHEKGLIHRDIKPGNILLEQSGQRVKLTDFGLAKAAEDVRLTRSGLVAGTPLYMSPEQASGEELDARSDLFSLGVVLYELATGQPPFNGKTPLAVLKQVTESTPVPLKERNPELPDWFVQIVDHLLAKKPADRFQSARQVADTLEHFWALLKSSETVACPKKKAASLWKTITLGVAAGLLTLTLGAVGVYYLLPGRDRREDAIPAPVHVFKNNNAGALWSLELSRDGKYLAMGNDNGTVKFWDMAADKLLWELKAHNGPIWALALSPDGQYFATGSDDGNATIWNMKTREKAHVLPDSGSVRSMAFDREGKTLLTGDRKGKIKIWNVQSGAKLIEKAAHIGLVVAVAFAPDGKTIASAGSDATIKIWDAAAATAGPIVTLSGHESGVYGIAFAPTGRYLASGSWDHSVRLWDLDSASQAAKFDAHSQDVWSVAFNKDGTLFASAGEDQMVRIWSVEAKKQVGAFRGSSGAILNVRFSPERDELVAGGKDGAARLWKMADLPISK